MKETQREAKTRTRRKAFSNVEKLIHHNTLYWHEFCWVFFIFCTIGVIHKFSTQTPLILQFCLNTFTDKKLLLLLQLSCQATMVTSQLPWANAGQHQHCSRVSCRLCGMRWMILLVASKVAINNKKALRSTLISSNKIGCFTVRCCLTQA